MIISSCPLRISLVGGSTDHPLFLKKYKRGSVISFPSNLRVYVTLHKDVGGINGVDKKFIINYSKREEVDSVEDIKNDIVRETLLKFDIDQPLTISLTSDVSSSGSGLASSSAYTMALVNAISKWKNLMMDDTEVAHAAYLIEKNINPYVGEQDFYGSLFGELKKITFREHGNSEDLFTHSSPLFEYFSIPWWIPPMTLVHTGITRDSTSVLSTIDIDKCVELLKDVDELENSIISNNYKKFHDVITRSWCNKKETSPMILENDTLKKLDEILSNDPKILSHKLCGAGNGGYFLVFGNTEDIKGFLTIPIKISKTGLYVEEYGNN